MTTTVNRVYVDPEGYIEDGKGHRFEDQNAIAKILYKNYRRGSIEQQAQWNIQPGKTYSIIEPIQVELMGENHPDCGPDARGCSMPCHSVCEKMDEHRLVARIVTEEEKPAPWSSITPERWAEFGQHYKGEPRQPAPVVDKPDKTASEILFDHGIDMNWTDSWFYEQAVKAVEHALRQQPTEWIPELRKAFEAGKGCLDWDEYHGWKENYSFEDWLKSLPEPPKP